MKKILFICWMVSIPVLLFAQHALEEIRLSENTDTRVLDINNSGFICGYYTLGGNEAGFVITPYGKIISFHSAIAGIYNIDKYDHYRVVGINDNDTNVILLRASDSRSLSGNCVVYKGYFDKEKGGYSNFKLVTGPTVQQKKANPTGINNYNDMVGWYEQDQNNRFIWTWRDSIVPGGSPAYDAHRIAVSGDVYRTFTGGINDNRKVVGQYYDVKGTGISSWKPFYFDMNTKSFTVLNTQNVALNGINNSDRVVGVRTLNGQQREVYGQIVNGSIQTLQAPIFEPGLMMNREFTGINDKGEIVGNYLHPTENRWVGFVYRPDQPEYRMPRFNFAEHTWKLINSDGSPNSDSVWTSNYWGNFDYVNNDPYSYNGIPWAKNTNFEHHPDANKIPRDLYYSWKAFVSENAYFQNLASRGWIKYDQVVKSLLLNKYATTTGANGNRLYMHGYFKGICYGFSYTVLQRHFFPNTFSAWFNLPANLKLRQVENSDTVAVLAIERTQLKQYSYPVIVKYAPQLYRNIAAWEGLFRLKSTYNLPYEESNPRAVAINTVPATAENEVWHSVLPYKIKTPQRLPFDYPTMLYDTMFIYDSNHPQDSTEYILVKSNLPTGSMIYDSAYSTRYPKLSVLSFNQAGIRGNEVLHGEHTYFLKPTNDRTYYDRMVLTVGSTNNFSLTNALNESTDFDGTTFRQGNTTIHHMIFVDNSSAHPSSFMMDTADYVNVATSNYKDDWMNWIQTNNLMSLSINRVAKQDESDEGRITHKAMRYTTNDNAVKDLLIGYVEMNEAVDEGVNFRVLDFKVGKAETVEVRALEKYQLEIIRRGGDTVNYTLKGGIIDGENIRELDAAIPMAGNTKHIINPYYNGPDGIQLVIYVDNENDGSYNDTIFLDKATGMRPVMDQGQIKVFPNPASDYLNIVTTKPGKAPLTITVSDITGRLILTESVSLQRGAGKISLTNLTPGMYFIRVMENGKLVHREKLLKQ